MNLLPLRRLLLTKKKNDDKKKAGNKDWIFYLLGGLFLASVVTMIVFGVISYRKKHPKGGAPHQVPQNDHDGEFGNADTQIQVEETKDDPQNSEAAKLTGSGTHNTDQPDAIKTGVV